MNDPGELDFSTWYSIIYKDEEYQAEVSGLMLWAKKVDIPYLNKKGCLIDFKKVQNENN